MALLIQDYVKDICTKPGCKLSCCLYGMQKPTVMQYFVIYGQFWLVKQPFLRTVSNQEEEFKHDEIMKSASSLLPKLSPLLRNTALFGLVADCSCTRFMHAKFHKTASILCDIDFTRHPFEIVPHFDVIASSFLWFCQLHTNAVNDPLNYIQTEDSDLASKDWSTLKSLLVRDDFLLLWHVASSYWELLSEDGKLRS